MFFSYFLFLFKFMILDLFNGDY